MKIKNKFFILFVILAVTGCSKKHKDPFYNDFGTWDSMQLPLLNPYYLIYITDEFGWQMPIKGNFPEPYWEFNLGDLTNIEKVSVKNGVIMVYSSVGRDFIGDAVPPTFNWFVMIPDEKNREMGFASEADLIKYVHQFGVIEPAWVDPNSAYKEFYRTGCYDWVPDCEK